MLEKMRNKNLGCQASNFWKNLWHHPFRFPFLLQNFSIHVTSQRLQKLASIQLDVQQCLTFVQCLKEMQSIPFADRDHAVGKKRGPSVCKMNCDICILNIRVICRFKNHSEMISRPNSEWKLKYATKTRMHGSSDVAKTCSTENSLIHLTSLPSLRPFDSTFPK